jgi:hypothetical protein
MKTSHSSIFFILTSLLLVQCKPKQTDNQQASLLPSQDKIKTGPSGAWINNSTLFYTSQLMLQENGVFTFHDQGCVVQNFTEGYWAINGRDITLTSFDKYKPVEKHSIESARIIKIAKKRGNPKKGSFEYSLLRLDTVAAQKFSGPNDTTKIYFDRVQMRFYKDTLFNVDQNKYIGDNKFIRPTDNIIFLMDIERIRD